MISFVRCARISTLCCQADAPIDPSTVLSTLAVAGQFTMFLCMLGLCQHFSGDILIGPVRCCTLLHECRLAVAHVVHATDAVTRAPNDGTPIERAVDEAVPFPPPLHADAVDESVQDTGRCEPSGLQ